MSKVKTTAQNLKLAFIIALLAILGLVMYGYFEATPGVQNQTEGRPRIEITPQSFDFGEIQYRKVAEHTFKVRNLGDKVLEIKRVATSCACTIAKINKEKISPGEEGELLVTYDTGAMGGPHGKGKQERIIYVKSNDPEKPQVDIIITANVIHPQQ